MKMRKEGEMVPQYYLFMQFNYYIMFAYAKSHCKLKLISYYLCKCVTIKE